LRPRGRPRGRDSLYSWDKAKTWEEETSAQRFWSLNRAKLILLSKQGSEY
jgi:hypothetical protein